MASGKKVCGNSANPFYVEDDDDTFIAKQTATSPDWNTEEFGMDYELYQKLQKKKEIEERMVGSTNRSVAMVDESERVGLETAHDLLHQREQLEKTERNLDKIKQDTRISQRHITSIKSMFGSMRNYFGGGKDQPTPQLPPKAENTNSALKSKVEANPKGSAHPGMRLRELDESDCLDDIDSKFIASGRPIHQGQKSADDLVDENLGEMSSGMLRLKDLALGLQTEIDEQNQMLDRITDKTENMDTEVQRQNRQMKKILRK